MMENTVNGMQATEVSSHTADFSTKSAKAWDDGTLQPEMMLEPLPWKKIAVDQGLRLLGRGNCCWDDDDGRRWTGWLRRWEVATVADGDEEDAAEWSEEDDGRTADDDERRGPNLLHLRLPSDGGTAAGEAEVECAAGHRGLKLRL